MPSKLNAGEVTRRDWFLVDVDELVIDESKNGRAFPPSKEQIRSLADSIKRSGQLQPLGVSKIADNRIEVEFGFSRAKAIKLLNSELGPNEEKIRAKVFLLSASNAEESLLRNIEENLFRADTTVIDHAHNIRRLKDVYGKSDTEIAKLYRKTSQWVSNVQKLLNLERSVQLRVHEGALPYTAAIELAAMSGEEQVKQIGEAKTNAKGKIKGKDIVKAAKANGLIKKGNSKRRVTEIEDFFRGLNAAGEQPDLKTLGSLVVAYINGTRSEENLYKGLELLFARKKNAAV